MNLEQLFPEASFSDLSLYFKGSLINCLHPKTNKWGYMLVDSFSETAINLTSFHPKQHIFVNISELQVNPIFPKTGFRSFKKTAVYFSRITKRQNQKGINQNNSQLFNLFDVVLDFLQDNPNSMCIEYPRMGYNCQNIPADLSLLFMERPFLSFEESLKKINSNRIFAAALSSQLAISCGVWTKNPTFWYGTVPVAEVLNTGVCAKVVSLHQELFDFFNPQHIEVTVDNNS
jgi:hypothetical protein